MRVVAVETVALHLSVQRLRVVAVETATVVVVNVEAAAAPSEVETVKAIISSVMPKVEVRWW